MSDEIKNPNNETAAQTAPKATDATAAPPSLPLVPQHLLLRRSLR